MHTVLLVNYVLGVKKIGDPDREMNKNDCKSPESANYAFGVLRVIVCND